MEKISKRNYVLYFWAAFDLFYIAKFIWWNISQGRISLFDDIVSFNDTYLQLGAYSLVIFSFSLLFNISIVFSAIAFLKNWKYVNWIVYAQTPIRLLFMVPSVSILLWIFNFMSINIGLGFVVAVVISEIIKIMTLYLTKTDN